ncbi:MAG: FAD-binding oxidoreductase, partial [Lachnospiraceae bacterium]|nr:FAD-binding oxidoreductase [Lachnospiraceae bacterium]
MGVDGQAAVFDAAVIGGGLLGCFCALNLSRRFVRTILLEKREDVCTGISRANTAGIYPGYDNHPGSL